MKQYLKKKISFSQKKPFLDIKIPNSSRSTNKTHVSISQQDSAGERANKIFRELDINGDGELDEDEFVKGCLDDGDLMRMLNSGGLDRKSEDD